MTHFLSLQSVDQIMDRLADFSALEAEAVPLFEAQGRILAAPFAAPENLPGFDRSTMDGFAVMAKDVFGASEGMPALLDVVGECPMGGVPDFSLLPGQCARIWTGGMLPAGADAVVMLEYAREAGLGRMAAGIACMSVKSACLAEAGATNVSKAKDGCAAGYSQIELTRPVAPLENVITADEDAAKGQILLPAGRILRPQELGLLAAFGAGSVQVHRKARVAIISSGDEVVPVCASPKPGQVRDINAYSLTGLVQSAGAESRFFGIAQDSEAALLELLAAALDWADVVLVSGGSSAGQRDCTVQAFAARGAEILTHGVAISPGKPLILARLGQKSLWGLPGHAAGALVCAEVFIRPLLRQLSGQPVNLVQAGAGKVKQNGQGRSDHSDQSKPSGQGAFARQPGAAYWRKPRLGILSRAVASAQGRRDYIRVRVQATPEIEYEAAQNIPNAKSVQALPIVTPVLGKSGLITTLVEADALIICPEDQEGLAADQIVELHELL